MAVRRISSWRTRASDIALGFLSHREVEPSTSVNRKVIVPVCVPVCGSAIRFASSFPGEIIKIPGQLRSSDLSARDSEVDYIEVLRRLHRSPKRGFGLGYQRLRIDEPACP